jgi:hypothetical protein
MANRTFEESVDRELRGFDFDELKELGEGVGDGCSLKRDGGKDEVAEEGGDKHENGDGSEEEGVKPEQAGDHLGRWRLARLDGEMGDERPEGVGERSGEYGADCEAEDELKAEPRPGERAVSSPERSDHLALLRGDSEENELQS